MSELHFVGRYGGARKEHGSKRGRRWLGLATLVTCTVCLCLVDSTAVAQSPEIVRAEAWTGTPFGVGKVSFRTGQESRLAHQTNGLVMTEASGRIFYPAYNEALLSAVFDRPITGGMQTVWFLFRGDQPLEMRLRSTGSVSFTVNPESRRPRLQRIAFQSWWRQFSGQARAGEAAGDYPPIVETYLLTMLQRRLGLEEPLLHRTSQRDRDELEQTLKLLFDVESVRADALRQALVTPPENDLATMPLPPPTAWSSPLTVDTPGTEVEAIARFVPAECYYLRFGNWNNQLWLKRLMEEYSGDLSRMISVRGHKTADTQKMLDQLVLESSAVDDWFGGNLIDDVAAIGTDLYMEDGASSAVLLLANGDALRGQIESRREKYARANADEGVTLTELEIQGERVTLLASPDNRVRSFHVVKDNCHLTSNSRYIVQRFLEAASGNRSLAQHPEFRMARRTLPLVNDYTVFVYLSRPFFENLLSPRYQVELARRNRSLANIQLLQLAQWAASNEGYADDDLGQMIQHGFLPVNFNQLPDGSSSHWIDGAWHDSARGRRGYFKPIADTEVRSVTTTEMEWLQERLDFFGTELKEVDPLLIAFKRFDLGNGIERVVIDGRVAPFGKEKYGWLGNLLGPPLQTEIAGSPDDLVTLQASLAGNMFTRGNEAHQIFLAIQSDIPPRTSLQPTSFMELIKFLKTTPGYIAAWPKPGYLDVLPALGAQPDEEGFTYSRLLDLWRLQFDDFSMVSFDRDRLKSASQWIHTVPAERPAQVRMRVGDIANSSLRDWANILFFEQGWETSLANIRLVNLMIQQFGLPPETAMAQVEQLLGTTLACPLGGDYVLSPNTGGVLAWQSTAWPSFERPEMPVDYIAPPMQWFRGMSLDVYQRETQFVIHGTLDIARGKAADRGDAPAAGNGWGPLPGFDMFKGFSPVEEIPAPEPDRSDGQDSSNQGELLAPDKDGDG